MMNRNETGFIILDVNHYLSIYPVINTIRHCHLVVIFGNKKNTEYGSHPEIRIIFKNVMNSLILGDHWVSSVSVLEVLESLV